MDSYWESLSRIVNTPNDYSFLPPTDESVWILGIERSSRRDLDEIVDDVRSRFWFTYRRGFTPIGGISGPTMDTGWGCMHRCGQMLVAQALLQFHLGREWRWNPDHLDQLYLRILKMFEDTPSMPYSIHSITTKAAASNNQPLSSWLGPNTVAHCIRKLSVFDQWTNLVVHVTAEDGIVIREIKNLCCQSSTLRRARVSPCGDKIWTFQSPKTPSPLFPSEISYSVAWNNSDEQVVVSSPISKEVGEDCVEIILPPICQIQDNGASSSIDESASRFVSSLPLPAWRPLLLIVPLRLGLHEFNMRYMVGLQRLFEQPQCVGVIGGRPNHALWIIGYVGDRVLCLDPHTTQPATPLGYPSPGDGDKTSSLDGSFHCASPVSLPFARLDPSLAVAFVCSTETDFDDLLAHLLTIVSSDQFLPPIIEIHETRPRNIPPPSISSPQESKQSSDLCPSNHDGKIDEGFEII